MRHFLSRTSVTDTVMANKRCAATPATPPIQTQPTGCGPCQQRRDAIVRVIQRMSPAWFGRR